MMRNPILYYAGALVGLIFLFSLFAYGAERGYSLDENCRPMSMFAKIKSHVSSKEYWTEQRKNITERISELTIARNEHILALDKLDRTGEIELEYEVAKLVSMGITGDALKTMLQVKIEGIRSEVVARVDAIRSYIPDEISRLQGCLAVAERHF